MLRALVLLSASCLGGGGGRALLRASLAFFREPHNAVTLMFLHLSCYAIDISKRLIRNHKTQTKAELFSCTLRSTLERDLRTELKWGSERIVRHLPVPCLRTPALSAASSSGVHFCFGAPIWTTLSTNLKSFIFFSLFYFSAKRWKTPQKRLKLCTKRIKVFKFNKAKTFIEYIKSTRGF